MLAGLITVAVTGSIEVGGLKKVWEINQNYGRINFFEYVIDRAVILIYSCYKVLHIHALCLGEDTAYALLRMTATYPRDVL